MSEHNDLNRKLAEWAEFLCRRIDEDRVYWIKHDIASRNYSGSELPAFTSSLDACFKWLVPKALMYLMGCKTHDRISATKYLFGRWLEEYSQGGCVDFALALCKAIEKLADSQENKI